MATISATEPQTHDLVSVGSRVSWGAIFGGSLLALAIYLLLSVLGAATGLSIRNRVTEENLRMTAVLWAIGTSCLALFVGGLMSSVFTVGENKTEAVVYGILTWALTFALVIGLGSLGFATNATTLIHLTQTNNMTPAETELATRGAWYAFAGTWGSMLAAALGGFVGAGPTFRVIAVRPAIRTTM